MANVSAQTSEDFFRQIEKRWEFNFRLWRAVYWALGAFSIILPAVAAIKPAGSGIFWNLLAAGGAICAALLTFFNAKDRADRFNAAWIVMRSALNADGTDSVLLNKAWKQGDYVINSEIFSKYIPDQFPDAKRDVNATS